jgi:hypothetical protein
MTKLNLTDPLHVDWELVARISSKIVRSTQRTTLPALPLEDHNVRGAYPSTVARTTRTVSVKHLFILTLFFTSLAGLFFWMSNDALAQNPYYRLQLKHGGQYLDATYCSSPIGLNPGSDFENGACQLWRLVPAGDGWNRLQLKHGGQYLDADHCSNTIGLNPGSNFENGACQLWRLVPVAVRID